MKIMEAEFDSQVAGYMGMDKTIEIVNRNFYWPEMAEDVEDYVCSYEDCQKNKAPCHKRHATLHHLELSHAPWDSIYMDFITQLPKSEGCSAVWVIVDWCTKMVHFILIRDGQKTAEGCAKHFQQNIWKLNMIPSSINSHRDPMVTSKFGAQLTGRLDVRLWKCTAFHPQTNGQTERVNQSLEQYLHQYCIYEQDNWDDLLPLAEYA